MKKASLVQDISIRPLLITSFMVAGLIPLMIVSLISFNTARRELKIQAFRQLESIRNIKKVQIENFFSQCRKDIMVFSANPFIIKAYQSLKKAFFKGGGVFSHRFKGLLMEKFTAPESYKKIHDFFFPDLKFIIDHYGYYDLFLTTPEFGDTIFTVRKETDFGIRIAEIDSSLRDVWKQAIETNQIALSDTKPYPPSHNEPAQFLAAPIHQNGKIIGIIAVQISIKAIDEIMKERSGMWKTGETYLVGQDKKMRSDSYLDKITHSVQASFNGTVALNGVDTQASKAALKGATATNIVLNYKQRPVLSAYSPIHIDGIKWAIIAEADTNEIDQQIAKALNHKILFIFIISGLVLIMLSLIITFFISNGIKKTLLQLNHLINDVLKGNLQARGDDNSVNTDFKAVVHSANQLIEAFILHRKENQKLEEHMQYTQKLKTIGILAGGIAHDFNNILTSMYALIYIIKDNLTKGSQAFECVNEMNSALHRASELVDQILTFEKQTHDEEQIVNVGSAISGTLRLLKATLPKNITISWQIPKDNIYIAISPSQLNQVVMNLCTNASYAMKDQGGTITVSIEQIECRGDESPLAKAGLFCQLAVSDTGVGIGHEIRDLIFKPFFTTKPIGQGYGMGLSVVRTIIEQHDGWIDFSSQPGQGSTFKIIIPLTTSKNSNENNNSLDHQVIDFPQTLNQAQTSILFIDDEIQICHSESSIIEAAGYRVHAVTKPREALTLFKNSPQKFSLVITDLNMPDMDGIQLAIKIQKIKPKTPIILTSGYYKDHQINTNQSLKKAGIVTFLKKPYQGEQLLNTIRKNLNNSIQ
jgi:signal transduction histidine kinase/ActR/RegA family two-component response regulator